MTERRPLTIPPGALRRLRVEAQGDLEAALRDLLRVLEEAPSVEEPEPAPTPTHEGVWLEGYKRAGSLWHSAKSGERVDLIVLDVYEEVLEEALASLGLRPEQWAEQPTVIWLSTTEEALVSHEGWVRVRVGEGPRTLWSRVRRWEAQ